jgi:hypothetical protein
MTKKKKEDNIRINWEEHFADSKSSSLDSWSKAFNAGKELLYEDIMYDLERKQIESKPELESAQNFVDGYNSGIRDAIRVVYTNRWLWSEDDWQTDRDEWEENPKVQALIDQYFE